MFLHCKAEILISVKPLYFDLMVAGEKTVELRRRAMRVPAGTRVWIYSTVPNGWVGAVGEVSYVHESRPCEIWDRFAERAGISRQAFNGYFNGADRGCAIIFRRIVPLQRAVLLDDLRRHVGSFHPPQFYKRLDPTGKELALLRVAAPSF
jgi:predicted transcriptional regulator